MQHRYIIHLCILFLAICGTVAAQPASWTSTGPGGGGAMYQPSFSPHNASELFVCSDMSNLFHSTNLGANWQLVHHRQYQGGNVRGAVQFTSDPLVVYGVNSAHDQAVPSKSTDGGNTWKPLAKDPTGGGAYSLVTDPASTTRLLVSDYSNAHYSTDGGASFSPVFSAGSGGSGCHIAGAFFDGSNIWVGTNAGVYGSTNNGLSFSVLPFSGIPASEAIVSFAGGKTGSTIRFFCVTLGVGDVYAGVTGAEHPNFKAVYTCTAANPVWNLSMNVIGAGDHPFFVAMARSSADIAYLGGGSNAAAPIIYRTSNGGAAWVPVFKTAGNQNIATGWCGQNGDRAWSYPEYALGFAVAPTNPDNVVITDLGCVHVTSDGGTNWRQAYLSVADQNPAGSSTPIGKPYHGTGLEMTSCWSLCWADSTHIVAGYTDIRGVISSDAGATWSFGYTGHTLNTMYHAIKHPTTSTLYAATSSVHDLYQSTYLQDSRIDGGSGYVLASTNNGVTWTTLHNFAHPVIWVTADAANPNRLYACVVHSSAGGIYVTNNLQNGAASTWTKLTAPPRTQGHPYNLHILKDGSLLCTFSGRRAGSPLNFTNSSGVFLSTDGGTTWQDRSGPGLLYWTHDITVDPADATQNTWYAGVYNGWGGPPNGLGGLYKTTNRGAAWTRVFTSEGVTSCAFRPGNPTEMYITTEQDGLYMCANTAAASPAYTEVTSFPFKQPQRVIFDPYIKDKVWVTTFGGGIFHGTMPAIPVELQSFRATAEGNAVLLEWSTASERGNVGFGVERTKKRSDVSESWLPIDFVEGRGTTLAAQTYRWTDASRLAAGTYLYRLRQKDFDGTETLSHSVQVEVGAGASPTVLSITPQPFTDRFAVQLSGAEAGDLRVSLLDMLGREVQAMRVSANGDISTVTMDASGLPPGCYVLYVRGSGGTMQRPVVKQ